MKSRIELLSKDFPKMKVAYIDMTASNFLGIPYGIFSTPAILLFIEGRETIREAGRMNMEDIGARIDRYYNLLFD